MLTTSLLVFLASAGLIEARSLHEVRNLHYSLHKRQNDLTLDQAAFQIGSSVDGTQQVGANVAQQAASLTSNNNFINNCVGKTLTNGFQNTKGSCNGITMGDIPSKDNMISSIITFPLAGSADIQSNTDFNITVVVSNLVAGSFTNADATYYSAPQQLQGGKVVGHTHVTVQDMGPDFNPQNAMDPTVFAFFKGINDPGDGKGHLSATVTGGLPAGNYRVCTLTGASNHQPVLMPVAQRGSENDCTKFTVIGNGNVKNDAASDGSKGIAAAALAQSALDAGPGFVSVGASATASSGAAASTVVDDGSGVVSTSAVDSSAAATTSASAIVSASAPFSNSTTKAGGKGGGKATKTRGGGKASTTRANNGGGGKEATSAASTSVAEASSSAAATTEAASTKASGGNGGGNGGGTKIQTAASGKPTGKRIITIIETFFLFGKGRGGLCPSVGKSGGKFSVLEELFDDLASAAAAACGHQFTTCITFKGPGFSVEECSSQKDDCVAVASTQKATASTPATLTASVTIPITATATGLPGSVVATETIAPTSAAATSAAAGAAGTQAAQTTAAGNNDAVATDAPAPPAESDAAASSFCSIVTQTVTVDAPAISSTALPTIISSKAPFSNSTATASAAASASSVSTSTSDAIGGIEAPPITATGDAARPFEVKGNTFANKSAAVQRSCDVQFNACANAVNGGTLKGVTLADCSGQQTACQAQ